MWENTEVNLLNIFLAACQKHLKELERTRFGHCLPMIEFWVGKKNGMIQVRNVKVIIGRSAKAQILI